MPNTVEGTYITVTTEDDESVTQVINEAGYVSAANLGEMKFRFTPGNDITDKLSKSSGRPAPVQRLYYTAGSIVYPDQTASTEIVLTDCVVEFRPPSNKADDRYLVEYVGLGIPTAYVDRIISDASKSGGARVVLPESVKYNDGYAWISANLEKLPDNKVTFLYPNDSEEGYGLTTVLISTFVRSIGKNIKCTPTITLGATHRTTSITETTNPTTCDYTLSVKVTGMYVTDSTDASPPPFEKAKKVTAKVENTESLAADVDFTRMALAALGISDDK